MFLSYESVVDLQVGMLLITSSQSLSLFLSVNVTLCMCFGVYMLVCVFVIVGDVHGC